MNQTKGAAIGLPRLIGLRDRIENDRKKAVFPFVENGTRVNGPSGFARERGIYIYMIEGPLGIIS